MKHPMRKMMLMKLVLPLLSLLGTLVFYPSLPETLSFGGQEELPRMFAFLLPFLMLLMVGILAGIPWIEQRRAPAGQGLHVSTLITYHRLTILLSLVIFLMQVALEIGWHGYVLNLGVIGVVLLGASIAFLGNYLPRVRNHRLFAYYNPWTLRSPSIWRLTHRLAGVLWLIGGLLMMLSSAFPSEIRFWIVLSLGILMLIVPHFYAWYLGARGR